MPLLLVLHGSRPMDWDFSNFSKAWRRLAIEYNLIVVVPESNGPTWDFLLTGQREDMDFIEFALDQARKLYRVDDQRVAVMGHSDGGSLGLSIALRNPDVFEAAIVQAAG